MKLAPKWRMSSGLRISINKMSTTHISNCLRCFVEGKIPMGYDGGGWRDILKKELEKRKGINQPLEALVFN